MTLQQFITDIRVECTACHPGSKGMADIVRHNAPVEYRRPCSCYFPPEWGLL